MTSRGSRAERGSTMIEVMVATTVLIIAGLGFAGSSQYAASSTGIGHRRTAATFIRTELIDRLTVAPRSVLRTIADASEETWLIDACYDVAAQRIEPANTGYSETFTCPEDAYYRSWINVEDNGADAWDADTNSWIVGLYVERMDRGCEPEQRDAAIGCVSADLLLTD